MRGVQFSEFSFALILATIFVVFLFSFVLPQIIEKLLPTILTSID